MKRAFLFVTFIILFAVPSFAGTGDGKTFLIHAKTSLSLDDAQICAVPNVAWTALSKGYKVIVLFDASGVTAIKKGSFFGAAGEWRDYAIDSLRDRAVFSIFRHASEMPLYRVEKIPALLHRQGQYQVLAPGNQILKRGKDLSAVLKVFDTRRFRIVSTR